MNFSLKYFILFFVCVSGYKIRSVSNVLTDDTYSMLIANQSTYGDALPNEFESDQNEFQRKGLPSTSIVGDGENVRSEALIKKFHPFVYPKQFNVVDRLPNREFNASENLMEIRNVDGNQPNGDRFDDNFGPDHKLPTGDMIPLPSHISKHGHFPYFDRPPHHNQFASNGNCHNNLLGILQCTDLSLLLLGILGFVAFVLNAVLGLVDRLNLPLLSPSVTGMATAVTSAPLTKALFAQRQNFDEKTAESHHKLLTDFERILQMAIDAYEHKINPI